MLAEGVTPFALSALKYGLFALLVLFLWRAMRWAVRGLSVEALPARGSRRARTEPAAPDIPPGLSGVVMHRDGERTKTVRVSGAAMVVGRDPGCELHVDDTYASQQHARLFGKGGAWFVEDLGSTNGTFVNDQRLVAPAMVQAGDRIRVGTTVLELRR
jgi:pSer/pThr/pTyr-binding forkhead associated (FHA) protein